MTGARIPRVPGMSISWPCPKVTGRYIATARRKAKQEANEISYMWDALIEHQSGFIRSGKAITVPGNRARTVSITSASSAPLPPNHASLS